jgi:hypothetical protein
MLLDFVVDLIFSLALLLASRSDSGEDAVMALPLESRWQRLYVRAGVVVAEAVRFDTTSVFEFFAVEWLLAFLAGASRRTISASDSETAAVVRFAISAAAAAAAS